MNDGGAIKALRPIRRRRPCAACRARPGVSARLGRAAQRLRPHRARLREQEALAEANVVFEQIDHLRLALDPLGDQADAEPAEQVGQVGGMDVGAGRAGFVQQERRRAP